MDPYGVHGPQVKTTDLGHLFVIKCHLNSACDVRITSLSNPQVALQEHFNYRFIYLLAVIEMFLFVHSSIFLSDDNWRQTEFAFGLGRLR